MHKQVLFFRLKHIDFHRVFWKKKPPHHYGAAF